MKASARPWTPAVLGAVLLASVLVVRGWLGRSPVPALPTIVVQGAARPEGCLLCHADTRGVGLAHAALGCSPCHLGDPRARDATLAHVGLERQAGDFATVDRTCALCHAAETARVRASLMARAPGILAVDRFAFGERPRPFRTPDDDLTRLVPAGAPRSLAESHVRKLCAGCHLGVRKPRPGDLGDEARGGGCTACHLAPPVVGSGAGPLHPQVSAVVPERRCRGCHGRSGRITMSYRGLVELEPGDPRVTGQTADGRPLASIGGDVHGTRGMTCLDCHVERELMGDGKAPLHAHEVLEVRCATCHGKVTPGPLDPAAAVVAEALRRAWIRRGLAPLSSTPLATTLGTPLVRTDAPTRSLWLVETGQRLDIPKASDQPWHHLVGHERLSCQSCHATWAPRCGSCHTTFEPQGHDVDHLSGVATPGRWLERAGGNGYGLPLLALGPRGSIEPFVEGMKATFALGGAPFERTLYAPLDPHTTGKSRGCPTCHGAVGDTFPSTGEVTRLGARLLDAAERARIARVGACLPCHAGYADAIYVNFPKSLGEKRPACEAVK